MAALTGWRRGALVLACGAVAALGLPPLGLWPVLFVSFTVFLVLLENVPERSWRSGFGTGWLFGLGYFAVAFHWIGFAFLIDAATYLWMMPFMLGILAGGMAIYWGLAAVVAKRLGGRGLPLVLAFAASIAATEWLRGHLFTGFPWAAPGLVADGMGAVAQSASIIGMTGLTLMIVLWASLPHALFGRTSMAARAMASSLLLILPLAWGYGAYRLSTATNAMVPGAALRIVQPNISQEQKWRQENARSIFEQLKDLSAASTPERPEGIGGVTHLFWPESAVPFLIDENPVAKSELKPLLGGRTVLVTGSIRRDGDGEDADAFNSIIVFDGHAEVAARYDKWRLVPGGEFLPLAWLLEPLGFQKVVRTPGSFTSGPGPRTMALPGAPDAGFLVCYEVVFPDKLVDPANRPGFLVNVTNDGWFGRSTGPYQHVAQARMRSIEQGLPLVRAANTGVSAVIDSYGRYLHQLPLMEAGVIDSPLPVASPATLYAGWGDWILLLMVALSAGSSILIHLFRKS
ncbi:apolipoprotein N-acyltransferase [Aestuariivirga sp.]|uniref:apolipoprotein N-acyltransferase n=1 Tax=Aestuariivirga sp. TaxID=2650926 RepID=UPI003593208B